MLSFSFPLNRLAAFPEAETRSVDEAIAVVQPGTPVGQLSVNIFYSLSFYEEGGNDPLIRERYSYDTTDQGFLDLMVANGGDTEAIAYAYLKTLPEFTGAIDV